LFIFVNFIDCINTQSIFCAQKFWSQVVVISAIVVNIKPFITHRRFNNPNECQPIYGVGNEYDTSPDADYQSQPAIMSKDIRSIFEATLSFGHPLSFLEFNALALSQAF